MRHFLAKFFACMTVCTGLLFSTTNNALATFYIYINVPSTGAIYTWRMAFQGTLQVGCGNGGTLSGPGVSGNVITKTDTSQQSYRCSYSNATNAGAKTIMIYNSNITAYHTSDDAAVIRLYSTYLTGIGGDLPSIFPYLGSGAGQYPKFNSSFANDTTLTSIPAGLFSGYRNGGPWMFENTFNGCTGLTSIPENLFSFGGNNISGQEAMFAGTFKNCTGLTSIPKGLFSRITSSANMLFYQTFSGCTNLTGYIPSTLFAGLIANGSPYQGNDVMTDIFANTDLATSCPAGTTRYPTDYDQYWNSKVSCIGLPYTVTYDCGDGSAPAPTTNTNATYDESFTPAASTCTAPNGYAFKNWLVDGTSDLKSAGAAFIWKYLDDKTFTAQYTPLYVITYDCGTGTGPAPENGNSIYDASFTPARNTCTKNGFHFIGWAVSGTNDVKIEETAFSWNYNENKTFTAQWAENTVSLSWFNGDNLFSDANASQSCVYNGTFNLPTSEPEAAPGYYFDGWTVKHCSFSNVNTSSTPTAYGYKNIGNGAASNASVYGLTQNGTWGLTLYGGVDKAYGQAVCSVTGSANNQRVAGNPDFVHTGNNCWCRATGYSINGGAICPVSTSSWIWSYYYSSNCVNSCASYCGSLSRNATSYGIQFRALLFTP